MLVKEGIYHSAQMDKFNGLLDYFRGNSSEAQMWENHFWLYLRVALE